MDDVLLVNVPHSLQDLLHVAGTGGLRVLKVVIDDTFKELSTCNAGRTNKPSVELLYFCVQQYFLNCFLSFYGVNGFK